MERACIRFDEINDYCAQFLPSKEELKRQEAAAKKIAPLLYIPDTRLETLIGSSLMSDDISIPRDLRIDQHYELTQHLIRQIETVLTYNVVIRYVLRDMELHHQMTLEDPEFQEMFEDLAEKYPLPSINPIDTRYSKIGYYASLYSDVFSTVPLRSLKTIKSIDETEGVARSYKGLLEGIALLIVQFADKNGIELKDCAFPGVL